MNFRRNLVIGAGIVFAVAATMAVGPSAARAQASSTAAATPASTSTNDELNQLRANQQLLQQRLDQLEQIAQVGPAHPQLPPGTASLAGSFPRSFLIPGTDTSIAIGGRVILDMTEWFHGGNPNVANSSNSSGYGNATISGLPINGTVAAKRSDDVFYMNVQNSRLNVETRTPTAFGEARTYIEFDFADCPAGGGANATDCSNLTTFVNPLIPRLRLAYATLGGWMFGQNWGIGTDLAAAPESFNSTGIVGIWGTGRVPEASYTFQIPTIAGNASLEAGIVMPESTMETAAGLIANDTAATGTTAIVGCTDCESWLSENPLKNEWPALAAALTWNQPWGHVQLHGAFHEIFLDDGLGLNRSFLGGGGGISGNFNLAVMGAGKDNIGYSLHAGSGDFQFNGDGSPGSMFPSLVSNFGGLGSGCYGALGFNGTVSTSTGAAAANPNGCTAAMAKAATGAGVHVQVPGNVGVDINFQHWWTPVIRSTLNWGYESQSVSTSLLLGPAGTFASNPLVAGFNHAEMLGSANLIWSPVPFVDTGFEAFYGKRTTFLHNSGTEIGIDYSFVMKF